MKYILLLALVFALMLAPMVMAAPGITGKDIDCGADPAQPGCPVPEFSAIGAGIALIGAGAGYWFVRSRKK